MSPFQCRELAAAGRFDETHLIDRIRAREFSLVVTEGDLEHRTQGFFSPGIHEAILNNYGFSEKFGTQYIYIPNMRVRE